MLLRTHSVRLNRDIFVLAVLEGCVCVCGGGGGGKSKLYDIVAI